MCNQCAMVKLKDNCPRAEWTIDGGVRARLHRDSWLKHNGCEPDEAEPLGIILCAGAMAQHIGLLELDSYVIPIPIMAALMGES